MKRYQPSEIEPKWQKIWSETGLNKSVNEPKGDKAYVLTMFPYPSGDGLHVGHVRNYTISDITARYARMNGADVLHPTGWDAFGLPAENFAIKQGVSPQVSTAKNTVAFRTQLEKVGITIDWDREINSSSPDYYRWTQWLFLLLFKRGLAYQKESEQWWCEHDKTVLANEQVEAGRCWRCGNIVTKKLLKQWFFKITDYADRLLGELDGLDWPDKIKTIQRNWIGRSEGAEIDFVTGDTKITVYTTRPDTLAGASFLVLAPEHPAVADITTSDQQKIVDDYIETTKQQSEIDRLSTERTKTGVFTGATTTNPITGEPIPIWIADYVLATYGTGAIMAVPAHDERDFDFATKFDLSIKTVVEPVLIQTTGSATFRPNEEVHDSVGIIALIKHWSDDKYLGLYWPKAEWGTLLTGGVDEGYTAEDTVLKEILEETGYKNAKIVRKIGNIHSKYYHEPKQLNRFGHAPTFYVELENDDRIDVDADELAKHEQRWLSMSELRTFLTATSHIQALELFENPVYSGQGLLFNSGEFDGLETMAAKHEIVEKLKEQGIGRHATKYKLRDWLISRQRYWGAPIPIIHCPEHGAVAVPEDQLPLILPEIADYLPTGDGRSPLAKVKSFVDTTCPTCGGPAERETDTMDTFADSSWYFLRFPNPHIDTAAFDREAVEKWLPVDFYIGGAEHAVLHLMYARFWTKVLYDEGLLSFTEPFKALRNQGMILGPDGARMSKSRGNVINPTHVIDKYGADTLRIYEMFIGPYDQAAAWSEERLSGINRFVYRIWTLAEQLEANRNQQAGEPDGIFETEIDRAVNKTIKKVHDELGAMKFNTAISSLMTLLNTLTSAVNVSKLIEPRHADLAGRSLKAFVLLLAPFAPYLTEELWHELGSEESIHIQPWPKYDPVLIKDDVVEMAVQVNGKLRASIMVATDASEDSVLADAKANTNVAKYLTGDITKTVFVPRRLINFVVK